MKKINKILFFLIILINYVNAEDFININDSLSGDLWTNYQDDKDYSLRIYCKDSDENGLTGILMNGICFIKENEEITILYNNAITSGGGSGGGPEASGSVSKTVKTKVVITKKNETANEKEYEDNGEITLRLYKNDYYIIEIWEQSEGIYNSRNVLYTITMIGVDKIITSENNIVISDYDGTLCFYKGKFNSGLTVNGYNYKLEISGKNVCSKNDGCSYPEWYVKKGTKIAINYKEGDFYVPYTTEGLKTVLLINEKSVVVPNLPKEAQEDMEIKLCLVPNNSSNNDYSYKDNEIVGKINIKVDETPPPPPTIGGTINTWTNENVTLTASESSDDKSGLNHYEYKVGALEWQSGSTCTVTAEEGQIVETEVKFRAVDNVGNASEEVTATVKIDKTKPVISADKEADRWTKEDIKIQAEDTGSGFRGFEITKDGILYNPAVENTLSESGRYKVSATDKVENRREEVTYLIDKTKPQIELNGYEEGVWTNKDVKIRFTDEHSGIKSVTVNGSAVAYENGYIITESGEYTVKCIDKTGNENSAAVKVDKKNPEVTALSFSGFGYETEGETEYLNGYDIKYKVTEEDSGINRNQLYLNGVKVNESTEKELTYRESQNISKLSRTERDERCEYKVLVTDNAGNEAEEKTASLTVPRKIILKTVKKDEESHGLRKSYIKDGYTINGILINRINFELYKEIRLRRTFLGDKVEGGERKEFSYEEYKARFDGSVSEAEIRRNWEECAQTVITEDDVNPVTIDGEEYWYYEDRIKTESGLGHRGIRYQAEWEWKGLEVREKGEYLETDKSANNPGRVKIRIEGTDKGGKEKRYMVLDGSGNRIVEESDGDFMVTVSGVVRLAVKIEDEDFDDYSVEATELVKAAFLKGSEQSEETLTVAMKGCVTDGYVEKSMAGTRVISEFRSADGKIGGWYEFANPEVKLYYNKPFNMKITMTEGCKGGNGAYKDVTESGVIRLKAGNPDIGGFRLLVGEEAGYNEDGITARPHQEIELGIEFSGDGENPEKIEWNYGDGEESEGSSIKHTYVQSPERKGNTSEYVLRIKTGIGENEKRAAVNVHIVDTQYGMILGDEEWIGAHPVLGRIQVPENVTLSVKENREENNNATVILGYGSALEERKGLIEILKGGKLYVNTQGVKFTEGKNGTTFTEVKTEKEGGEDESLKWGGIVIRGGSEASYIKNAEIKYAVNGITAEEGSTLTAGNIEIKDCSEYGLKACGEVKAETILIEEVTNGVYISKDGKVSVEEKLKILNGENGIECDGTLMAGRVELEEISEKGMCIKGKAESLEGIIIKGSGKSGIETARGAEVTGGRDIRVQGFEEGIRNRGRIRAGGELGAEESRNYGIRNEGVITAEKLSIKTEEGRGYVCGSGSDSQFKRTQIEAGETGIHSTGTARAEFGKSEVSAEKYGIKTDRDKEGSPSVKMDAGSRIEDAAVLWYDWEGGVLTEEEIEEKLISE